jgi:predicted transposase YbfD/YdcC
MVKGNQPKLEKAVMGYNYDEGTIFQVTGKEHGRLETRIISTLETGPSDLSFPFVQQVFKIERTRETTYGKLLSNETVFGISSLSATEITPQGLLEGARGHWSIENKLHYVRDVSFSEDKSQVRDGQSPRIWASMRNLAIGLIRDFGFNHIPSGRRYFGFGPKKNVLEALGIYSG